MQKLLQAERLMRTIDGERADRVPNFEFFFDNPAVTEHFIGKQIEGIEDTIAFARAIGWGSVRAGSCAYMLGQRNEEASDGTMHYAGGSSLSRESFESLSPPPLDERIRDTVRNIGMIHDSGLYAHVFILQCFHAAATGMGLEHFCMMCYDDQDFVAEVMEAVEEYNRRFLEEILRAEEKPDIVIFDADCAYKTAMMVAPELYRDLAFEPTQKTCELLKENGIRYLFHSDGKIDQWYPMLIELGASGVHGVEKQANDLADIKALFGDRLTLFGNMDPVFIAQATPEAVYDEAVSMIETAKTGGRYVAAVNTIVKDYVPLENYLSFLKAIEDAGRYE